MTQKNVISNNTWHRFVNDVTKHVFLNWEGLQTLILGIFSTKMLHARIPMHQCFIGLIDKHRVATLAFRWFSGLHSYRRTDRRRVDFLVLSFNFYVYGWPSIHRLQNIPYFCVFKYATREQSNKRSRTRLKTESETWGETLKIRTVRFAYVIFVRITRFSQPRAIRIG